MPKLGKESCHESTGGIEIYSAQNSVCTTPELDPRIFLPATRIVLAASTRCVTNLATTSSAVNKLAGCTSTIYPKAQNTDLSQVQVQLLIFPGCLLAANDKPGALEFNG